MSQSGRYFSNTGPFGFIETLTADTGGPVGPTSENINVLGGHDMNTAGYPGTSTIAVNLNNNITLGDLAGISAGDPALLISSGDITFDPTDDVGNINLAPVVSGNAGVITYNGTGFTNRYFWGGGPEGNNIFIGYQAGSLPLTAFTTVYNIGIGYQSLNAITGSDNNTAFNTCLGSGSGMSFQGGTSNTFIGYGSANGVTTACDFNTFLGSFTGQGITTLASYNTLLGYNAGNLALGNYNTYVGQNAGGNGDDASNSSNIYLGSYAVTTESNAIRIGNQGSSSGEQNTCYIAGIVGVTVSNKEYVTINSSTGQLGVSTASSLADSFLTNSGTATPSSGVLTIDGGSNMGTTGSGSTVTINLNNSPSVSGSITAATGLIATTGGISAIGTSYINHTGSGHTYINDGGTGIVTIGNSTGNVYLPGVPGTTVSNPELVTINSITGQLGVTPITDGSTQWNVVTVNTPLVAGNGYFANSSSLITFTLPITAVVGDTFDVSSINSGGWQINQNASQFIQGNSSTTVTTVGTGGNLASNAGQTFTSVKLVCSVANTEFNLVSYFPLTITFT